MTEPKRYIEEPTRSMGAFLSDEAYALAIRSFIIVCTDFVPVNRDRKTIYLANRIVHSSKGVWRFGGRQRAGETMRDSCVRLAKRELDLATDPSRFKYLATTEDVWAWRQQEPQDAGGHNLIHTFSIECTPEELKHASAHLDPNEYDASLGIQEFDRARLVAEKVRPQLLDMYDAIFPNK